MASCVAPLFPLRVFASMSLLPTLPSLTHEAGWEAVTTPTKTPPKPARVSVLRTPGSREVCPDLTYFGPGSTKTSPTHGTTNGTPHRTSMAAVLAFATPPRSGWDGEEHEGASGGDGEAQHGSRWRRESRDNFWATRGGRQQPTPDDGRRRAVEATEGQTELLQVSVERQQRFKERQAFLF